MNTAAIQIVYNLKTVKWCYMRVKITTIIFFAIPTVLTVEVSAVVVLVVVVVPVDVIVTVLVRTVVLGSISIQ